MDDLDRRRVFMRLTEKDRDAALYNMVVDEISERVKLMARLTDLEVEVDGIGRRRDITQPIEQDTAEKIRAALAARFDSWVWFRDKVLPSLITFIVMGVLYLVFGGKLTP